MIVGLGADHAGYVKRLKGIVNALSNGNAEIDIRLYNIVNLIENGKQVKFSKRKGNTLGLSDLKEKGITCQELKTSKPGNFISMTSSYTDQFQSYI